VNSKFGSNLKFRAMKGVTLKHEGVEKMVCVGHDDGGSPIMRNMMRTETSFSLYVPPKNDLQIRFKV
jgi:hypothetical protein